MKEIYTIKSFGPSVFHLGRDYALVKKGDVSCWVMGSTTYIAEFLRKVCALLKVATLRKEKLPCSPGDHPKLYLSPLLSEAQHRLYQKLVSMTEWKVHIGRFDICYAVISLNIFSASPQEGDLTRLLKIFGYLQNVSGKRKSVVVSTEDIGEICGKVDNTKNWL